MVDLSRRALKVCGWILTLGGFGFCFLASAWTYWFVVPALPLLIYGATLRALSKEAPE